MVTSGGARVGDRAIAFEAVVPPGRVELTWSRDADRDRECAMEHRLGTRVTISMPVRIIRARATLAFGRLLNASSSGAYIETSSPPPLLARIDVICGCSHGAECAGVPAYVTRVRPNGVGVEWLEFAPAEIRQLLLGRSGQFEKRKKTAAGVRPPGASVAGAESRIAPTMMAPL